MAPLMEYFRAQVSGAKTAEVTESKVREDMLKLLRALGRSAKEVRRCPSPVSDSLRHRVDHP